MVDQLDTYLCAYRFQSEATGDLNTDPREIIATAVVDGMDYWDHRADRSELVRQRRLEDALYLVSIAPQCAIQK